MLYSNPSLIHKISEIRFWYTPIPKLDSDLTHYDKAPNKLKSTDTYYEFITDSVSKNEELGKECPINRTKYNYVWGVTKDGDLVFLQDMILNLTGLVVDKIKFKLNLIEVDELVIDTDFEYSDHTHLYTPPTKFDTVIKRTNFVGELLNNELFTNNNIIRDIDRDLLDLNKVNVSDLNGVILTNFKYESMPKDVVETISDKDYDFNSDKCLLMYRGDIILYRNLLGKYKLKVGDIVKTFDSPILLIDQSHYVDVGSKSLYKYEVTDSDIVSTKTRYTVDKVGYMVAYYNKGNYNKKLI